MNAAQQTIAAGLKVSRSIAALELSAGALAKAPGLLTSHFGEAGAFLIADGNTWEAAGRALEAHLRAAGLAVQAHLLPAKPKPKPSVELAEDLTLRLAATSATPVAVGSGVINDVVKYAAFKLGRPYLCVATATSMDGYTSAGAPLSEKGFKKTIQCKPPRAIIGDLDVLRLAPRAMSSWGYSDLAGKIPAGADWIIADDLGVEAIETRSWGMVQDHLHDFLSRPEDVARGNGAAIEDLFAGLAVVGFAMELHGSSRPASGADHQIAHLWEMQDLALNGELVSHGSCVAVGALTALQLYDWLLQQNIAALDIEATVSGARSLAQKTDDIKRIFGSSEIGARSIEETRLKHVETDMLRLRLSRLKATWPQLAERLRRQVLKPAEFTAKLRAAGAPAAAADIGVDTAYLRRTVLAALYLRSRYTILDVLDDTGLLETAVSQLSDGRETSGRAA
ncbi:sn-glycerol-1-phosphate dehydrogenase [Aestuariivirga sp.]|uniref:sn-glycerol-1-phosphate dehydrogenase n=1 Tax=Aestuariivirga sp. TaxID=2650926 RepID=UPI003783FFF5